MKESTIHAIRIGKSICHSLDFKFQVQEENCNPNERDFDGATPLHYAASRGQYKVIDWLLREGRAKITLDNIGGSPLHNAAETGQIRVSS